MISTAAACPLERAFSRDAQPLLTATVSMRGLGVWGGTTVKMQCPRVNHTLNCFSKVHISKLVKMKN